MVCPHCLHPLYDAMGNYKIITMHANCKSSSWWDGLLVEMNIGSRLLVWHTHLLWVFCTHLQSAECHTCKACCLQHPNVFNYHSNLTIMTYTLITKIIRMAHACTLSMCTSAAVVNAPALLVPTIGFGIMREVNTSGEARSTTKQNITQSRNMGSSEICLAHISHQQSYCTS